MSDQPRIVAFAASLRAGSFNRNFIEAGARAVGDAGGAVTLLDLREYPLPLYDGDHEKWDGLPDNALRLKKLFSQHDGFMVSCPEYNGSITPLFKNTIDWASRPLEGKPGLGWARGKPVALMAASNGALGGLRGLLHARWVLQNIGMMVLPGQRALGRAASAFNADGTLVDAKERDALASLASTLVDISGKLSG
jgi:NAD(P)H-dependent FMN reductase